MSSQAKTVLRPYQALNIDQIDAALPEAGRGVLYQAPTGSGKSITAAGLTKRRVERGQRVLLLSHRKELMRQLGRAVNGFGLDYGIIAPGHRVSDHAVHIGSIDTIGVRLSAMRGFLSQQDLVLADECHHISADRWNSIWDACDGAERIGQTATPYRLSGESLGPYFDKSVHAPSVGALIEMGWLSPLTIYQPPIAVNLSSVKTRAGDYVVEQLAAVMDDDLLTDRVIAFWDKVARGRPTIAFCVNVKHAHNVAARFRRVLGINALAVDGYMDEDERDAAISGLSDGAVDLLTAAELVSEGLDIGRVSCAIFLRPTKSTTLMQQQTGRAMRIDDEFYDAIIVDVAGNVMVHGMPDEIRPWSLIPGTKGMEKTVPKPVRCIHCYRVQRAAEACVGCGRPLVTMLGHPSPGGLLAQAESPALRSASVEMLRACSEETIFRLVKTEGDVRYIARVLRRKPEWIAREINRLRVRALSHL